MVADIVKKYIHENRNESLKGPKLFHGINVKLIHGINVKLLEK